MKFRTFLIVSILFLSNITLFAQNNVNDKSYKSITAEANKDVIFDKTIDYLQDNGYFLQSLDKLSGFIQASIYIKDKKVFSSKNGERRTLNFIIRPMEINSSKIILNIYSEEKKSGGDGNIRTYYYDEQGIIEDKELYRDIFDELLKSL